MKKIVSLLLLALTCGFVFQACNDSKTYAELLQDEKAAINKFIKTNSIKVITASEFEKNGNKTNSNPDVNEYVQLSNGVYMQIVNYGDADADSIKSRDVIVVRFMEYNIISGDTTNASNYYIPDNPDVFDYTIVGTTAYGQFRALENGLILSRLAYIYGKPQVPEGWLTPLQYIKTGAQVKLIVPSKVGHSASNEYVYPFYYDLRQILVW